MSFIKNKCKEISVISLILLPILVIYTLLIYLDKIPTEGETFKNITFIVTLVVFLFFGLISGKIESRKGWLAGLTSALIVFGMAIVIKLLCESAFDLSFFLKYSAFICSGILGGIIGINFHKKK